ncbi:hypothetical protein THAOC_07413 [Thalassiosira oceanica]|uniref:Aldoketomutase n=1 Tax=Thalassiosira oceanica TaxID=159749 RepID=K0T207_THAOC|nr:hypothetical protein THAOC_07413 [Thalassiosira oceanica]|eukprot:EJK71174.1 hypothetical protein THAOC_07413 [Thalassiosira oceanica]
MFNKFASASLLTLGLSRVSAFAPPAVSYRSARSVLPASQRANIVVNNMSTEGSIDVSSYMGGAAPEGTEDYISKFQYCQFGSGAQLLCANYARAESRRHSSAGFLIVVVIFLRIPTVQQTMIRVKDPKESLDFYCNVLGFKLVHFSEFPQWSFNVYFVAPPGHTSTRGDKTWERCMTTPGCLELTWNYGSEKEEGKVYNTGNADSTGTSDGDKVRGGFGHIGITVPNVYKACERFHSLGVEFHKSPNAGGMKGLAFIKDPDGYLVEVLPQGEMVAEPVDCLGVAAEGGEGYKDNSK